MFARSLDICYFLFNENGNKVKKQNLLSKKLDWKISEKLSGISAKLLTQDVYQGLVNKNLYTIKYDF